MEDPKIAAKEPIAVEVEAGKKYFFCACGESANQPFCDGAHSGTDFQPLAFTAEKTGKAYLCQCKNPQMLLIATGRIHQFLKHQLII